MISAVCSLRAAEWQDLHSMACTPECHVILKLVSTEHIIHCSCYMVLSTGDRDIAGSEYCRAATIPYCLDTSHAIDKFDRFYAIKERRSLFLSML